ncbi:MAG: sulfite exporter TauE/SafE family protein [Spirochaetaceae bacterium]
MYQLIVVFLASLGATLLSVMSGGGASIITVPLYIWAGVSLPVSIAANKVGAIFWTPIPAYNYLKDKKIDWAFLCLFAGIGLIGAYIGVQLVVLIDTEILKPVIGLFIVTLVLYMHTHREIGLTSSARGTTAHRVLFYPFALVMGLYESILGSGNGIIFTSVTCKTRGYDFITALGYYFGIAFFWGSFTALLYAHKGYFDLKVMAAAVLGSVIGGFSGSKIARYKGNSFTKKVFIVVGLLLGIRLIFDGAAHFLLAWGAI